MEGEPSPEFHIREAHINDLGIILHHRRAMFHDMGFVSDGTLDDMSAASRPFIEQGLAQGFYKGWLAETECRVVAGGGLLITPWVAHPRHGQSHRAYILNMYTEPEFRRRGLATRLVQIMIDHCREQGLGSVALHASDEGRPLYESLGFEFTNEMRLLLK